MYSYLCFSIVSIDHKWNKVRLLGTEVKFLSCLMRCLHYVKSVQIRRYLWSEYRKIRTRNNSVLGHFSRSVKALGIACIFMWHTTVVKFLIRNIFNKCKQISSFLQICSPLLKKSLMETFIFYAVVGKWLPRIKIKRHIIKSSCQWILGL